MSSLWGANFDLPTKEKSKKLINKANKPKSVKTTKQILTSKNTSIEDKLKIIEAEVHRILGVYEDNTICLRTREELHDYISTAISNGIIAVDTETNNSLDPLTCKIMGGCIYTPGLKNAYIPINHTDLQGNRLENQCTEQDLKEEFERILNLKIIYHNAKFDFEVIKCTCKLELPIYWDTMIGAKVLNELERAGLKQQYIEKIDSSIEKYSIEELFKVEYQYVSPELFALYAATDSYMTYKLYEYQLEQFSKSENSGLYSLFKNIEMPVIPVVADMELTGVTIDKDYSARLSDKYHKMQDELQVKINAELKNYDSVISAWRLTPEANEPVVKNGKPGKSQNEQLDTPVNLASPTQLAILLYDILKCPVIDKKSPRGTGEEILKKINLPICDLILQDRGLKKLINTYIDKLPECVSEYDGRLHAHFNQFGADTGRFSSSDPNLQNIPSHNNEIRMMFTASPGNVMVGSDFSQQEPRLLSHYSNDENMINAYKNGKDLYAMIASKVYHNNYEDNLEFNPNTGAMQPDGKKRRTSVKGLLLGIMYGRGTASIAENLNCSIEEATSIKQGFFDEFPKVETWINETQNNARKTGYVVDIWGRRRRLPDLLKEPYEITSKIKIMEFNPILESDGTHNDNLNQITNISNELTKCRSKKATDEVKAKAKSLGFDIKDNGGFIAQAERQCVNARIQGGAASMSKRAMVRVYNNQELKNLGFKLLIAVHDELIGECPVENKEKVKELLSYEMIESAKPEVQVPMKCDADDFPSWYYDVYSSEIKKEYDKNGNDFEALCENHIEMTREQLIDIIK